MKHAITILFMLCAGFLAGQSYVVDTTYILVENGTFYNVRKTVDDSGRRQTLETPITDTTELQGFVYRIALDKAFEYASYVNEAWKKTDYTSFILAASQALQGATGKTLFAISAEREGASAVGNWQVSTDSGATFNAATITQPTETTLQITVGGQSYSMAIVGGAWVRILGFQGGVDLHRVNNAVEFRNLDETIILKK